MIYCITDIETTGGSSMHDSITEIASILTDGTQILKTFQTLVRPDRTIPRAITLLTGITNEMVANAPTFDQIAADWLAFAQDATFVAHNVGFDLGFVSNALARLDLPYHPKKLCTVRLSRKILPGFPSYSLSNLCGQLSIPHQNQHRAMGDAEVTAQLFHLLIANDKNAVIQQHLNKQVESFAFPPFIEEANTTIYRCKLVYTTF